MKIEFDNEEVQALIQMVNNTPVRGAQAMVKMLSLLQRLQEALDGTENAEAIADGNSGEDE